MSEQAVADKLRYLFWRHLSWQSRLKVIAALDLFPDAEEQPPRITLENAALEIARVRGKLP